MTRYNAQHGKHYQNTLDAIKASQPFKAGNLYATREPFEHRFEYGQLPLEWCEILKDAEPKYIVWSYETPIAWLKTVRGYGKVMVVPAVKYSPTTSRHQSTVRRSVPEYEESEMSVLL